jgi:MinD-like ATPase involved in chromosome partitioning or flagellar assembly/ActR/RegA family two-component response regulator
LTVKIALIEDSYTPRFYRGDERIEYYVMPYTTLIELTNALNEVAPDLVIVGEGSFPIELVRTLKCDCAILLATDSIDILKWRKAVSFGFENLIKKPVTYEKIATALEGKVEMDEDEEREQSESPTVYIEDTGEKLPRIPLPKQEKPATEPAPPPEAIREKAREKAKKLVVKSPDEKGKLITFFNTKGGVGKTLYCINTALYAAKMYPSKKVVLVDFDLDFGDTANFLGLEPKITALSWQHIPEDSLKGAEIENYLLSHPSGIYLLPAPIPPINEEIFTFQVAQKILTTLKRHFDLVLVDTGPTLRDVVVITVENADRIFLVTTPSISSLRNVYDLVRIFEGLKVDPAKINIILNAVKRSIDTNEIKKYIPYEIALKVPYIKQVEEMHDNYEFALENKRFRLYLDELLEDIVGTPREERGFWAFLKGLVGA